MLLFKRIKPIINRNGYEKHSEGLCSPVRDPHLQRGSPSAASYGM